MPPFSLLKNWIAEGVLKSPFFKDAEAKREVAAVLRYSYRQNNPYSVFSKKAGPWEPGQSLGPVGPWQQCEFGALLQFSSSNRFIHSHP